MHYHAADSTWAKAEAERAFGRAVRARRRASLRTRAPLLSRCAACLRLAVHHDVMPSQRPGRGRREIPLDTITGTLEPHRAEQFDSEFRPAKSTRSRWLRVWISEHRGTPLPPILVVQVGDAYAIRDGHHRVSVARARGAVTIDAIVS